MSSNTDDGISESTANPQVPSESQDSILLPDNENPVLQLELLREYLGEPLSERDLLVVKAIAAGLKEPASDENERRSAHNLDNLCPALKFQDDANSYLWGVWEAMTTIASSPGVTVHMQQGLVRIVEHLTQIAKGNINVYGNNRRVWRDLPQFFDCLDASFHDPTDEDIEFTPYGAQIFQNISAFAARCLEAGLLGPYDEAFRVLRNALEEEPLSAKVAMGCSVLVACTWIGHGSKSLLAWARDNLGYVDVPEEDNAAYVERGSLYDGPATMCLRRWGFWIERLEELAQEESGLSEDVRNTALRTAQRMRKAEEALGQKLSE